MILIADSGATKTDWVFGDSVTGSQPIHTQGINPFHLTEQEIRLIISEQLVGQLPFSPENISHIFFTERDALRKIRRHLAKPE